MSDNPVKLIVDQRVLMKPMNDAAGRLVVVAEVLQQRTAELHVYSYGPVFQNLSEWHDVPKVLCVDEEQGEADGDQD